MDWKDISQLVIAVVTLFIPVLLLWMNAKIEAAKVQAAIAAKVAERTNEKVGVLHDDLNGRITMFMLELTKQVDAAFERGRMVGGEEMTHTTITQGQQAIKAQLDDQDRHLEEQDRKTDQLVEAIKNGPKK